MLEESTPRDHLVRTSPLTMVRTSSPGLAGLARLKSPLVLSRERGNGGPLVKGMRD